MIKQQEYATQDSLRVLGTRKIIKQKRKNFLLTLVLTFCFWIAIALTVLLVDPEFTIAIPVLLLLMFLTIFFTLSLMLGGKLPAFTVAGSTMLFLTLRLFGLGNIATGLFIAGITVILAAIFIKR